MQQTQSRPNAIDDTERDLRRSPPALVRGVLLVPHVSCHDPSIGAHAISPGFVAIPWESGMSITERMYKIDHILASRRSASRKELEESLGVSWATLKREFDLEFLPWQGDRWPSVLQANNARRFQHIAHS
jgi:hypothetical protein